MSGPYFKGQKPTSCGCYYPDVHLRRDVPEKGQRILHCINHGEFAVELGKVSELSQELPIPSEEWLKKERERLRNS